MIKQIFGWGSLGELEHDIRTRTRDLKLLEGYLVFAYKNDKKTGTIGELIISKRLDTPGFIISEFPIGGGWTGLIPNAPFQYLKEVVTKDLISNKTDKEIIKCFEEILTYEERNKNEYSGS